MTAHPNDRDWDRLDALVDEDPIALRDAAWRLATALTAAEHRADEAEVRIKAVRVALSSHPRACEKYPDDYVIRCGWKSAVLDVQAALDGEQ